MAAAVFGYTSYASGFFVVSLFTGEGPADWRGISVFLLIALPLLALLVQNAILMGAGRPGGRIASWAWGLLLLGGSLPFLMMGHWIAWLLAGLPFAVVGAAAVFAALLTVRADDDAGVRDRRVAAACACLVLWQAVAMAAAPPLFSWLMTPEPGSHGSPGDILLVVPMLAYYPWSLAWLGLWGYVAWTAFRGRLDRTMRPGRIASVGVYASLFAMAFTATGVLVGILGFLDLLAEGLVLGAFRGLAGGLVFAATPLPWLLLNGLIQRDVPGKDLDWRGLLPWHRTRRVAP